MKRYEYMVVRMFHAEIKYSDYMSDSIRNIKCDREDFLTHLPEWGLEGWLMLDRSKFDGFSEIMFAREVEPPKEKAPAIEI